MRCMAIWIMKMCFTICTVTELYQKDHNQIFQWITTRIYWAAYSEIWLGIDLMTKKGLFFILKNVEWYNSVLKHLTGVFNLKRWAGKPNEMLPKAIIAFHAVAINTNLQQNEGTCFTMCEYFYDVWRSIKICLNLLSFSLPPPHCYYLFFI